MRETRIQVLHRLLKEGSASTQEEIREELEKLKFRVTQSTISRDLRKLGAVRAVEQDGRVVYRLNMEDSQSLTPRGPGLVMSVEHNGTMIVVHTSPGSASLLARVIDHSRDRDFLGTIAGDDTIFIAPRSTRHIEQLTDKVQSLLRFKS